MQGTEYILGLTILGVTLLIVFFISSVMVLTSLYHKKQTNYLLQLEQLKLNYHNTLLEAKIESQEQTFKQISTEIHDNIGQKLALVKLNLLRANIGPLVFPKVDDAVEIIDGAISDLRLISSGLSAEALIHDGLINALVREQNLLRNQGLEANLIILGEYHFTTADNELLIYRIIQEAIGNILKHSQATVINISFEYETSGLKVTINDNGIGFNYEELLQNTRINGLVNMENRAKALNGEFYINSTPGNGTLIYFKIPLQNEFSN